MAFINLLFLFIFCLANAPLAYAQEKAYYAFYPSSKGSDFKKFQHNILGFAIDMPVNWTFGVVTKNNIPVVLLYPDGLNTGEFSATYETIEIGKIPLADISLEEAKKYTQDGLKLAHPGLEIVDDSEISKQDMASFILRWPSKTKYTVYEYISLFKFKNEIRSIAVRTTFDPYEKMNFYKEILNSFNPAEEAY